MFTGIIEAIGTVQKIEQDKGNLVLYLSAPFSDYLQIDQSVAHDGVCLTVTKVEEDYYQVEAVEETLAKTNLGGLKVGDKVNLERALTLDKRLDGHVVQGHVDTVGICKKRVDKGGSTLFSFQFPEKFAALIIEKGSIAVSGISLTAFNVTKEDFSVSVIPHTLSHTTLNELEAGAAVNLEFDLVGKYVLRSQKLG